MKKFGRARGATLYMTLLAAFQVLLHRYTGQTDFAIGSPSSGRNHHKLTEVVGYFVNPLVLRADLVGNPTFEELLEQVRRRVLAAFEHQVTGVSVSEDNRIFVNFPRWTEDTPISVAEVALMGRYPHLGALAIEGPSDLAIARDFEHGSGTLSTNTSVVHGGSGSLSITGRTSAWNGRWRTSAARSGSPQRSPWAAALARYPGATVLRVETDSDGVYEAHLIAKSGQRVTVEVDKAFKVTGEESGPGHP